MAWRNNNKGMIMAENLGCPFCGGPALQALISNYPNQFLFCPTCMPDPIYGKIWNTRYIPIEIKEKK